MAKQRCEGCGHSFDERAMYQMMTAWVPTRKRSASPKGKRWEQRWACLPCVEAFAKTGKQWEQLSLL